MTSLITRLTMTAWARSPSTACYVVEVLLAGQELILGIHEGDAAAIGGNAADIDIALGELADDDGRLVAGLGHFQIFMPGHCASPDI